MDVRSWFRAEVWRLEPTIWVLVSTTFVAVIAFVTTPWLALASVAAFAAAFAYVARVDGVALDWRRASAWATSGTALAAYVLLSLLWTGDPGATVISALLLLALLAALQIMSEACRTGSTAWFEHTTRTFLVAFLVMLTYHLSEVLTDHAIKRALFRPFLASHWRDGGVRFDPFEGPVKISGASIKWNMPALDFLLWPAMLMCALQLGWRQSVLARTAMLAVALIVTGLSDHKASLAAFPVSIAVFAAALSFPVRVRQMLMATWVGAFVLIVPLVQWAFHANLHTGGQTSQTLAARMVIWHVTADELVHRPLLGVGAAATGRLDNAREKLSPAPMPEGFMYPLRTGPHAHNIYLQSLYELGIAGTLILALLGLSALHAIGGAHRDAQPYLLAAAATVMMTSAASFGLFEPWYMGAYALSVIACLLAAAYAARGGFRGVCPAT